MLAFINYFGRETNLMAKQPKIQLLRLSDLQPSQLYVSQEKLNRIQRGFDPHRPQSIEPIPYKALDGLLVMTDGHTRAFAAHLAGIEIVPAYADPDDLDWEAYRICVRWCHSEGIHTIANLAGRVVNTEDYERLWHDRCRVMQSQLAEKRVAD